MKQQAYLTDTEYIEAMMKRFKLVDMRKQYRDLVLEAESSCMGYEAFLKRLLSVEEEGKRSPGQISCAGGHASKRKNGWRTLITVLTGLWTGIRSWSWAGWDFWKPMKT